MFNVPGYVGVPFSASSGNLLDQAIQALGGVTPQHYWDFTKNRALFNGVDVGVVTSTPNWSFSRASTGYAQTAEGALVSFGSGVPRITNKGLLVEDARTNLLLQSQTLATAPWSPFQASISADATAAPDGTTTADKLVEDTTAASTHFTQQSVTLTASVQTISVYAKAAERSQILFFIAGSAFGDATARFAYFDLATGAVGAISGAGATSSIEALTNGWYRCILNLPATLAVAANIQIGIAVAGSNTFTGNGTSGLFLWGAQVEASTAHSSYITTTTVTVTRPADSASITSPSVNYPLSVYTQFNRTMASFPANTIAFNLDDGTASERTTIIVDATASTLQPVVVGAAGVTQYNVNISPALGANVTTKLAVRVSAASANSARDNVLQTASGAITVPAAPTRLFFGMNPSAAAQLNGYLLRTAIFNFAATNTQLQAITR